jgi:hypothetical protein
MAFRIVLVELEIAFWIIVNQLLVKFQYWSSLALTSSILAMASSMPPAVDLMMNHVVAMLTPSVAETV